MDCNPKAVLVDVAEIFTSKLRNIIDRHQHSVAQNSNGKNSTAKMCNEINWFGFLMCLQSEDLLQEDKSDQIVATPALCSQSDVAPAHPAKSSKPKKQQLLQLHQGLWIGQRRRRSPLTDMFSKTVRNVTDTMTSFSVTSVKTVNKLTCSCNTTWILRSSTVLLALVVFEMRLT